MQATTGIVLTSLFLSLSALGICLLSSYRQARLLKRYRYLLSGNAAVDLEALLLSQAEDISRLHHQVETLTARLGRVEAHAQAHLQRTATVRFNAFPDTGSDLSFAIAFLDGKNNGVVMSSLYGRAESRIYAKPVESGASTYPLSDEERQAIAKAIRNDA